MIISPGTDADPDKNRFPSPMTSAVQTKPDTETLLRNICVNNETAAIAASELVNQQIQELEGVTIYSGWHKEYGNIHIVIPAMGDGVLLLPFAFRDF